MILTIINYSHTDSFIYKASDAKCVDIKRSFIIENLPCCKHRCSSKEVKGKQEKNRVITAVEAKDTSRAEGVY